MPRPSPLLPGLLLLAALLALLAAARLLGLDLSLARLAHDPASGWPYGERPLWRFVYHFANLPALLAAFAALVVFLLSLRLRAFAHLRRHALFLILCFALGPGLIVNALLKGFTGRPRPRDVSDFGGEFAFEPLLAFDPTSPGKSFPCGHCSTGFFFFAAFFVALALHRRAWPWLAFALALGALLGAARIVQGGHFLTDVLTSAVICLALPLALWYALGLHRPALPVPASAFRPVPWPALALAFLALPALAFAFALGTPFHGSLSLAPSPTVAPAASSYELSLELAAGHTQIAFDPATPHPQIEGTFSGHGLPGSGLKHAWRESPKDGGTTAYAQLKQRRSGLLTEVTQSIAVSLPTSLPSSGKITLHHDAAATFDLTGAALPATWQLAPGEGQLTLILPPEAAITLENWPPDAIPASFTIDQTSSRPSASRPGPAPHLTLRLLPDHPAPILR